MRGLPLILLLVYGVGVCAQNSGQSTSPSSGSKQAQDSSHHPVSRNPGLEPPRSDRVNIDDLGNTRGESSSKSTQIDLSPPTDDAKAHPKSSEVLTDADTELGNGDVSEMHPWDPHKAAKDIEVGDFYFKQKNYRAAESRYREALYYKDNDAVATYRLAVSLEKLNRPDEAVTEFESYLRILPHGPYAEDAKKAIERLRTSPPKTASAKE